MIINDPRNGDVWQHRMRQHFDFTGYAHSPLHNYIVPGLTSYLVGLPGGATGGGCVRLFAMTRALDTHRYAALGNSIPVPVVEWIGRRIAAVEAMTEDRAA